MAGACAICTMIFSHRSREIGPARLQRRRGNFITIVAATPTTGILHLFLIAPPDSLCHAHGCSRGDAEIEHEVHAHHLHRIAETALARWRPRWR